MSITVAITAFCKDHPNYQGRNRPTQRGGKVKCWGCDDLYVLRHPKGMFADYKVEKVEVKNNG